jgi:predicted transcriptional regulator
MATAPFSIRLTPESKTNLEKWAKRQDRTVGYLVQKAVDAYLEDLEEFDREMAEAEAELEKGEFISEEAMLKWISEWSPGNRPAPPRPDIFTKKKSAA